MEGYGQVIIDDDIVVRRGSINREIARLDSGWVCGITKIDREIRWRSAHNNASTSRAGHRTTLCTVPPAGIQMIATHSWWAGDEVTPPQTIISLPVQTAV